MPDPGPNACPYEDLHIYWVQGVVPETLRQGLGGSFLGNWVEEESSFLFFTAPAQDLVDALVARGRGLELADTFCIPYRDWQADADEPLVLGRFFVAPPWSERPCPEGLRRIVCDPSVVFGTGTHPTTRDCLAALEEIFDARPPSRVLDLGTGTGLLALAAAALGAEDVLAVDLNPLAVTTARRNVAFNGMESRVRVVEGRAEDFAEEPAGCVAANIHYDVMKRLVASPGFLRGKDFVLSGLLRSEARAVENALQKQGASISRIYDQEGTWFTFLGKSGQ